MILKVFRYPDNLSKIVAVYRLLIDTVPLPRIFEAGHNYMIMEDCDGEIPSRTEVTPEAAMNIGHVLRQVHSITFSNKGLLDAQLKVSRPWRQLGDRFWSWTQEMLEGQAGRILGITLCNDIRSVLQPQLPVFENAPSVLCHGDLDATNILMQGNSVRALLDWEFAYAGPPFADFGQLLRLDFDWHSFAAGYCGADPMPDHWRRASLAYDMMNLLFYLNDTETPPDMMTFAQTRIPDVLANLLSERTVRR